MGASRRFLLLGGTGQIGWELRRALAPLGEVLAPTRADLDLGQLDRVREAVTAARPHVVVNAAAYTAVDAAEENAAEARILNEQLPVALAAATARVGAALVHYSTDYVFDGSGTRPYVENDTVGPLNVYGASKLAGERAVCEGEAPFLVFRTGWVYGLRGRNFMRTVRRLAVERDELTVVNDQWGAPTWSRLIAEATAQAIALGTSGRESRWELEPALYHLTAGGVTTWHKFADAILSADPQRASHRVTRVVPVSTDHYPTAARRPGYSVLSSDRLEEELGIRLPGWDDQLGLVMEELSTS